MRSMTALILFMKNGVKPQRRCGWIQISQLEILSLEHELQTYRSSYRLPFQYYCGPGRGRHPSTCVN